MRGLSIAEQKKALRAHYIAKRSAMPQSGRAMLDIQLADSFTSLPEFISAKRLICTYPTPVELDTRPIIAAAHSMGKQVLLPRCAPERQMVMHIYDSGTMLQKSAFGIMEPAPSSRQAESLSGSICLVPALCADSEGYRLGYGGGYFDRFLERYTGFSVVLIYPGFKEVRLPREATDQPVSRVIQAI